MKAFLDSNQKEIQHQRHLRHTENLERPLEMNEYTILSSNNNNNNNNNASTGDFISSISTAALFGINNSIPSANQTVYTNTKSLDHFGNKNILQHYHCKKRVNAGWTNNLLDTRFIMLLVLVTVIVISYKIIITAMPYVYSTDFSEIATYAEVKFNEIKMWLDQANVRRALFSIICGLGFSFFSFLLVYIDSNVPGVCPPSPFSPRSKKHYRQQKGNSMHCGYLTALAAGLVVATIIFWEN